MSTDQDWLRMAVDLATKNASNGGGPFGAVIVRDGQLLATGVNRVTTDNDPSAHAEIVAIRAAGRKLDNFKLAGCVLYSSCEPCPMCMATAMWARLDAVHFAADRDDAARAGFSDRDFYETFDKPRESWAMTVSQLSQVDGKTPFDRWLAQPNRVEY
ncbi:MAG TPA: nucleoside deaminase [Pseudonocardiaceae bacterium]|nr:nucleoside deaminase [Pseudonocardiaceae bacterium]